MKLKDLIGIVPDEQPVWIGGWRYNNFENVEFSKLKKEVKTISVPEYNDDGGLKIELQD